MELYGFSPAHSSPEDVLGFLRFAPNLSSTSSQRRRRHAPRRLAARVHAALRARAGVRGALPPEASLPRAPGAGRVAVRAAQGVLVLRVRIIQPSDQGRSAALELEAQQSEYHAVLVHAVSAWTCQAS